MKLSEILKDWPEKWMHTVTCDITLNRSRCTCNADNYNNSLDSCDREIDREALAKAINSTYKIGMVNKWNIDWDWSVDIADHIISTMPTWLKRSER